MRSDKVRQRILRVEREDILVASRLLVEEEADARQETEGVPQLGRRVRRAGRLQLTEPAHQLIIAQPSR